jgi:5-methyltetrahydrofolate--homocysteine methyltransferase
MKDLLKSIADKIGTGQADQVLDLTKVVEQAIGQGMSAQSILNNSIFPGMNALGVKFKNDEVFIPEVLITAKMVNECMSLLKPQLTSENVALQGRVVIGTVQGDLHDIGKNLVGIILEGAGWEVIDIGINVPLEKFIEAVKEYHPDFLGLSALLTTTTPEMHRVIEIFNKAGLNVKIIVGGAPITQEYADQIGADGYAQDAMATVELLKRLK